jgi:LytS/YehU family sensor histidine kinase
MPYLEVESPVSSIRDKAFWGELLYRGVYFISFGSGYWFARNAILGERKRRILVKQRRKQEQLRRTERDLLETELAFLKFQFNPHFLYNTLNYFYAETSDVSEKVADGILKLSDILRYSLRESLDNKVALTDEIHFLENFIDIHQLRFNNCLHIHFQVEGKVEQQRILPLVLISFVENALKHGNLTDPAAPLVIQLTVCDANIQFYVKNKKSKQHREMVSTGLGLANVQRRLAIAYPAQHQLSIEEDETFYTCQLLIYYNHERLAAEEAAHEHSQFISFQR